MSIFDPPSAPSPPPLPEPQNLQAQALDEARRRRRQQVARRDRSSLIIDPGVSAPSSTGLSINPPR